MRRWLRESNWPILPVKRPGASSVHCRPGVPRWYSGSVTLAPISSSSVKPPAATRTCRESHSWDARADTTTGVSGEGVECPEQRQLAVVLFHAGCATASEAASNSSTPVCQRDHRALPVLVMHVRYVSTIVPRKRPRCPSTFVHNEIRH
jgi:hypothetical protein